MYKLNDSEREYRNKTSGPKYLMKGPRMDFAVIVFQPGESIKTHYHAVMEENFYLLEGEIDIEVDGETTRLVRGDFAHVEPGERHRFINNSGAPVRMTAALAPHLADDKYVVEG